MGSMPITENTILTLTIIRIENLHEKRNDYYTVVEISSLPSAFVKGCLRSPMQRLLEE